VLSVFSLVCFPVTWHLYQNHDMESTYEAEHALWCAGLSFVSLLVTLILIPTVAPKCIKANLFGRDINKNGTGKVPETLGIVSGIVCIIAVISLQWTFPGKLGEHNAALISMCLMLLLGFCDDVLDLRWRDKLILSFVATVPLLIGYTGETTIQIPRTVLRGLLGISQYDLGYFYYVFMANTVVFCTNSINIYAGINGLETGQSIVMAIFVLIHNCLQVGTASEGQHVFSIFIMLPFLATTLGLYNYNQYPSRVFVGDSFTYFSGMTFAVCGILGHFCKSLIIIFIPQLINFIVSLPQLFHIIPCPRHRLPKYDPKTGKLYPTPNLTLINIWLRIFGPATEKSLCIQLLIFQVICCSVALVLRNQAAFHLY